MAFCGYLKQSTAAIIMLGPFVDEDDGKTAEVGLAIAQADVRVSKNGGNMAQKNDANAATHDEIGIYSCELDATDTATLGLLDVMVHESGALPVHQTYQVVVAHWWDTMCSTDYLQVDVIQVSSDTAAANNLELACDNYSATRGLAGTALPAAAADAAGGLPISDAGGLDLDTQIGTDIDAILTDTNELQTDLVDGGRLDLLIDLILADTGELQTDWVNGGRLDLLIDAILADTAEIGAAGAGLTAVPWNAAWDAEVESEVQDAIEVNKLDHLVAVADADDPVNDSIVAKMAASDGDWSGFDKTTDSQEATRDRGDAAWTGLATLATGTAQAGAAGTITLAAGASATNDLFNGTRIAIIGGTGAGQSRLIVDYDGATKVATVSHDWTTNPDATSTYEIQASEADAWWARDWTLLPSPAARSGHNALRFSRNKWANIAGTLTIYEEDDVTTAWTATITDDAAADNVVTVDPA